MLNRIFWVDALERAAKSAAQAVLGAGIVGDAMFDVFTADWRSLVGAAITGAILSVLTSIVSVPVADTISPASLITRKDM
jgi:hypothetical protein